MTEQPANIRKPLTVFVQFDDITKRISGPTPTSVEEFFGMVIDKFDDELNNKKFVIQTKDKEFDIDCEVEDINQLYNGARINVVVKKPEKSIVWNNLLQMIVNESVILFFFFFFSQITRIFYFWGRTLIFIMHLIETTDLQNRNRKLEQENATLRLQVDSHNKKDAVF